MKYLISSLAIGSLCLACLSAEVPVTLKGAGATFPYPIYAKWFDNFNHKDPHVSIVYSAVGSEAGVRRLLAGEADFGASEDPRILHQLGSADDGHYLLFPSVVGAVVPVINLPGFTSEVCLTPQTLAGIYLGTIKNWEDPMIRAANSHTRLPNLDIVVIHREDGSGTTYAWTDYLSQTNGDWRKAVGTDLAAKWPVGRPATGNDGVAKLVKELGGSIGYVEFIYALKNHLTMAKVQNKSGNCIAADLDSIAAAANDAPALADNFKASIVDAPGPRSYPVATFTWLIVPSHYADESKQSAMKEFLQWMLGPGQRQAAALGYLSLPQNLVSREVTAIEKIQ